MKDTEMSLLLAGMIGALLVLLAVMAEGPSLVLVGITAALYLVYLWLCTHTLEPNTMLDSYCFSDYSETYVSDTLAASQYEDGSPLCPAPGCDRDHIVVRGIGGTNIVFLFYPIYTYALVPSEPIRLVFATSHVFTQDNVRIVMRLNILFSLSGDRRKLVTVLPDLKDTPGLSERTTIKVWKNGIPPRGDEKETERLVMSYPATVLSQIFLDFLSPSFYEAVLIVAKEFSWDGKKKTIRGERVGFEQRLKQQLSAFESGFVRSGLLLPLKERGNLDEMPRIGPSVLSFDINVEQLDADGVLQDSLNKPAISRLEAEAKVNAARAEAEATKLAGLAQAEVITATGKAEAERLAVIKKRTGVTGDVAIYTDALKKANSINVGTVGQTLTEALKKLTGG